MQQDNTNNLKPRSIVSNLYEISEQLMLGGMKSEAVDCIIIAVKCSREREQLSTRTDNGKSSRYVDLTEYFDRLDEVEFEPDTVEGDINQVYPEQTQPGRKAGLELLFDQPHDVDIDELPEFDFRSGTKKYAISKLLASRGDRWFTSSEIVEHLNIKPKTVTAHLSDLSNSVWIDRIEADDVERCTWIYRATKELTAKFRQLQEDETMKKEQ